MHVSAISRAADAGLGTEVWTHSGLDDMCAAAVKWTSGALYSAKEAAEFRAKVAAAAMTEEQRLAALRADQRLPLVFLDVTIKVCC